MTPDSLETLFTRYRTSGRPEPLGELFDRASPRLLAVALHLCAHPADAEDALQATFVAAIDAATRWDSRRPVLPWLLGILTKQCRRVGERRARRRERQLPDEPLPLDDGSPVTASERRELVARVREHVDRLPVEQRQVVLLQLEHGLAPAEVAEVLGVPPGTVRMRLHRAVQALRGVLPAGLLAVLVAALPSRGLAAVRAAVVEHGAVAVLGGGALAAKKLAVVAGIALVLLGVWVQAPPWQLTSPAPAPAAGAAVARATLNPPDEQPPAAVAPDDGRAAVPSAPAQSPGVAQGTGTLRIVAVHATSGAPVAHLPLRISRIDSDVDPPFDQMIAATDRAGRATVGELEPGPVRVVGAAGAGRGEARVVAGTTVTAEVRVPAVAVAPRVARGRVVHGDGRPAAGATIVIGPRYEAYALEVAHADAAGAFALELPFDAVVIGARMAGCSPSRLHHVPDDGGALELVLPGAEAIADGFVTANGAPLVGAWIDIGASRSRGSTDPPGRTSEPPPPQRLRSGAEGRFVVMGLPAGTIDVSVRADGHAPFHRFATLVAGERTAVVCELRAGTALRGRVVDQRGAPVVGARVSLGGTYGNRRTTGADGVFGYRHVAPGTHELEIAADDVVTRFVEREHDGTEWLVEVERAEHHRLRLVDDGAAPLANWQVAVRSRIEHEGRTDGDGRVTVAATAGDGSVSLWLGAPGAVHAVVPWPWAPPLPGVETTIVVPRAELPAAVVHGRVADADGAPLAIGEVALLDGSGRILFRHALAAASFRFERVPRGDWVLEVAGVGNGRIARFRVPGVWHGETRDCGELRLPLAGWLRARVVHADGREAPGASMFLFHPDGIETPAPPRDGQPHPVATGSYRWQVMGEDAAWARGRIDVRTGETASLDVVLQPGVRRYVRFPVPAPDWGAPARIDYVLRAPDGGVFDEGDFDPRTEMPFRYMPGLTTGRWRLELTTDDGRRFAGTFAIDSLEPSREPIDVTVTPAR